MYKYEDKEFQTLEELERYLCENIDDVDKINDLLGQYGCDHKVARITYIPPKLIDMKELKAQKYDQLTEQFGCPVEVVIKALENGFYFKGKRYKGVVRLIYNPIDKDYELELVDEDDFVYLYDHKKTWWTKEDLSE